MKDLILQVKNISYSVNDGTISSDKRSKLILNNISFELERGKTLSISGQSGSGKTTLAKILAGIYLPTSGKIEYKLAKNWDKSLPKPIQILFQNDGNLINPYRTVKDVLNEAFELKLNKKNNYADEVKKIFTHFNLSHQLIDRKGFQLSGGEQQRIALARITIVEPEILILDEPFSSQDVEAQLDILNIINQLKTDLGLTVICISHDLNILKKISDSIIITYNGSIVENANTAEIFSNPQNDYTKFLLRAQLLNLSYQEIESFHKNYE
jgi:ABC-type dipeptide/oligopeptide/nickel transport system ATPase subunit